MNYLQATLTKIENTFSLDVLKSIEIVVNTPSIGWGETEKAILNSRIQDAFFIIKNVGK